MLHEAVRHAFQIPFPHRTGPGQVNPRAGSALKPILAPFAMRILY